MSNNKLGPFLAALLTGTADIGLAAMPILAAYKTAKTDADWKEEGFTEWLANDPNAPQMLERVLGRVKDRVPLKQRAALILALGGIPPEE